MPYPIASDDPCSCAKPCSGHHKREPVVVGVGSPTIATIPSVLLEKEFSINPVLGQRASELAKKCMEEENTVKFFWEHMAGVKANRAKGVIKAQKTRALKKNKK